MSFAQRSTNVAWRAEQSASQSRTPAQSRTSAHWGAGRLGDARRWLASRLAGDNGIVLLPEIIAIFACIALIWVSLLLPLVQERRDAEREAVETTDNLARAFEQNTDRIVSGIDQILLSARAAYADNESGFDVRKWVSKRAKADKFDFFIGRVDEHGISGDSTLGPKAVGINLADREHFRVHLDPTHDDLFIS
jgi:hypothetical protein